MILKCKWCSEESLDSIAQHLIDCATITVNSIHHQLKNRIEKPAGLLWITVSHLFGGAFYVRAKYRDLFALTFQCRCGCERALVMAIGGAGGLQVGSGRRGLPLPGDGKRCPTVVAKLAFGR